MEVEKVRGTRVPQPYKVKKKQPHKDGDHHEGESELRIYKDICVLLRDHSVGAPHVPLGKNWKLTDHLCSNTLPLIA